MLSSAFCSRSILFSKASFDIFLPKIVLPKKKIITL
nr:MAG TPA: hypothetical protein [Caudoviricetes sp.]